MLIAALAYPYVYGFLSGDLAQAFAVEFLIDFTTYGSYASMAVFYPDAFPT